VIDGMAKIVFERMGLDVDRIAAERRAAIATMSKGPYEKRDVVERFWSHVRRGDSDACWEWRGATTGGYGELRCEGRSVVAHRFAYALVNGTIPDGLLVGHRCLNPACCNPVHLFTDTPVGIAAQPGARPRGRPITPSVERFLALVDVRRDGCWEWVGNMSSGVPSFKMAKHVNRSCRQFSWATWIGVPVPRRIVPTCGDRKCVNPLHLQAERCKC